MARQIRCLDLFCGIGGNHLALIDALHAVLPHGTSLVTFAIELNDHALDVYRRNFHCAVIQKKIEDVDFSFFLLNSPWDIWLMSPPCQPFTRLGEQRDLQDARCAALLRIVALLQDLPEPSLPRLLFVENVKNFENSQARNRLVKLLFLRGYTWKEYLLNPTEVLPGWPNSRLRYYLLAEKSQEQQQQQQQQQPTEVPTCNESASHPPQQQPVADQNPSDEAEWVPPFAPMKLSSRNPFCRAVDPGLTVGDFLSSDQLGNVHLVVPPGVLARWGNLMDFVGPSSVRCCCFTKGYGHKAEGSGSILSQGGEGPNDASRPPRFFDSEEIARFLGFPVASCSPSLCSYLQQLPLARNDRTLSDAAPFSFCETVNERQRWMLLGNSVNVLVVAAVLYETLYHSFTPMQHPTDEPHPA